MILTSNFKTAGHLPQAVAISLGVPRGWRGARCTVLAPPGLSSKSWTRKPSPGFTRLRSWTSWTPMRVINDLGGDNFILLCWEAPGEFCHRRVVAAWMQKEAGVLVEEFNAKLRRHQDWLREMAKVQR